MNRDAILKHISKVINKQDPSAQAYLFGSQARGDNKPGSDWDILILINNQDVTNDIEDKFRDALYNIELESGQIISTFIYPKSFWQKKLKFSPLYKSVKREGIKL
ncbi:MAG: nucleotidyltransferase domain-containing protein [Bacteroidales bacterium]|nr:nucleotidyltransferase domain-containing protein [Bacteroidales bacterium]